MSATSNGRPDKATPGQNWRWTSTPASVRHYLGAYLVELGGADVIVFTGGIGENGADVRTARLPPTWKNWESCSIPRLNRAAKGEARVSAEQSRVQVWVMPTNEELIVARLAAQLLEG